MPAIFIAFAIDECAWVDVYAVSGRWTPSMLLRPTVARSRAAISAQSEALDAVS